MNRPYKRNKRNVKSPLLFFLLAPMLLIPLSAFGYAKWNDTLTIISYMQAGTEDIEITAWHITSTNSYDIDCDEVIFGDELKIENVYDENGQVVGLIITADPIFPSWELELVLEIHNAGTIPVYLSYEIYYSWDQINWVQVVDPENPTELYDKFRIVYTDGLYDEAGELWDPTQYFWPCEYVYKIEHLLFDAQDRPDLQGQTFTIKVEILGTV